MDRKRKRLELMMLQETKEIEDYVKSEKRRHEEQNAKYKKAMAEKDKQNERIK